MRDISAQEKRVFDYISRTIAEKGYSPSVRDIQKALSIKSTSTVHSYIKRIESYGLISKEEGKSRTLRIEGTAGDNMHRIPVLGRVRAGSPIAAEENFDGYVEFTAPKGIDRASLFALRVEGMSMKNAGVLDGDTVIVSKTSYAENGDIVVALVNGCATVKRFYRENGHFRLQPENETMEPIILDNAELLGKVIASIRYYL